MDGNSQLLIVALLLAQNQRAAVIPAEVWDAAEGLTLRISGIMGADTRVELVAKEGIDCQLSDE